MDGGASYDSRCSEEDVRFHGEMIADLCRHGYVATEAAALGWADPQELERMAQAWLGWADDPDAFEALAHVHFVAVKP